MRTEKFEASPNQLINEKSPYLLQHAYNPVNWYPWSSAAFQKAEAEDKPIFLSIGYSTCHWCHVMEKESFTDPQIADLLNETFVCIKVDREERPDIDSIYMRVCQMMTGSGGWPLTIIMTPNKKPFFATTYIPNKTRFGRIGLKELIPRIKKMWESSRQKLIRSANKITSLLRHTEQTLKQTKVEEIDETLLESAYNFLSEKFDEQNGGFGTAPKFPTPHNLLFLLRYWNRTGEEKPFRLVSKTLREMRLGGIYDHVSFGFHRYSTDSTWLIPHFEKMLYDQALMTMAYTEAYQATHKQEYKETTHQVLSYVLRDMADADGGFYSAEDADSEGEEGKFYLWTEDEIDNALSPEQSELIKMVFNVDENGDFQGDPTGKKSGKNILNLKKPLPEIADQLDISLYVLQRRLEQARRKLFATRKERVPPYKDSKILTDWNGLMIAALSKAGRVFQETEYLEAAEEAVQFLVEKMYNSEGKLYHRYYDGEAAVSGFLDDYAFLIWGLIELYEGTFQVKYLDLAVELTEDMIQLFWDKEGGGFYLTSEDVEDILVRKKELQDSAYPSGNSVAFLVLIRLAKLTANTEWEEKVSEMLISLSGLISKSPASYTHLMVGVDFALGPSYEVVIVGDLQNKATQKALRMLRTSFVPNKVVIFRPVNQESPEITRLAGFTKHLSGQKEGVKIYVCRNYECNLPTSDPQKMLELLNAK
ncbi:MAG: thioredoxin domain-containing protein [Thermoproteota archaeon]